MCFLLATSQKFSYVSVNCIRVILLHKMIRSLYNPNLEVLHISLSHCHVIVYQIIIQITKYYNSKWIDINLFL